MKDRVKDMFAEITMPEACAEKIRKEAAEKKETVRRKPVLRPVLAAVMALALVLCLSPHARAAVSGAVRHIFGHAEIRMDAQTGEVQAVISYPTQVDAAPSPDDRYVEAQDGRVIFHSPEGNVDITDQISINQPYIYTYVDEKNYEHILIMGGTADNLGVSEFLRQCQPDLQPWEGWEGGYSENYLDSATGKAYPWLKAAWDTLELPWPMPGQDGG